MPPAPAPASRCSTDSARTTIEDLVRRVEKIETAIEPRFQEHFVEAMAIPHKRFENPELAKVVTLPAKKESAAQRATRGRRGRRAEGRARDENYPGWGTASLLGSLGWWLGAHVGLITAVFLSAIAGGVGLYFGYRWFAENLG